MVKVFTDASKIRICIAVEGKEPVVLRHTEDTVNQAELDAIFQALTSVHDIEEILSDSELSVRLINGQYMARNENMLAAVSDIREANRRYHNGRVKFTHVHREDNPAGIYLEKFEKQLRRQARYE